MSPSSRSVLLVGLSLGLGVFAAQGCGMDPDSGFVDTSGDGGNGSSGGASGSNGSNGISSGGDGDGGGGSNGTSGSDSGACEGQLAPAQKLPLKMLIALDQSGSMGNTGNSYVNLETRWKPVTAALKAFWSNPLTEGISANLRLFPVSGTTQQTASTACNASAYASADVDFVALPNAAPFEAKLVENPTNYSTPTRFVLQGTVAEADALLDAEPTAKVVVVLVTDGKPEYCPNSNSGNNIAACKSQVEGKRFPTYVIGIAGQEGLENNVRGIAEAGGGEAFFVSTSNAQTTQEEFVAAMDRIRTQLSSCEVLMPEPPPGQSFERDKTNVTLTSGAGQQTLLDYNQECAAPGTGWKFDDVAAPTRIVLCDASCTPLKEDPSSKVDVEFGCTRRGVEVH